MVVSDWIKRSIVRFAYDCVLVRRRNVIGLVGLPLRRSTLPGLASCIPLE